MKDGSWFGKARNWKDQQRQEFLDGEPALALQRFSKASTALNATMRKPLRPMWKLNNLEIRVSRDCIECGMESRKVTYEMLLGLPVQRWFYTELGKTRSGFILKIMLLCLLDQVVR